MRFTATFLALLAIAAIGIGLAEDQSVPDGTIYGHVYDAQTKQPVSGAWVYCQEAKCKQTTDSDGYYAIENCFSPSSTYVIECTKNGYATTKNTGKTDSSGKAEVDFNLGNTPNPPPKPYPSPTQVKTWKKTFCGPSNDYGHSVQQTNEGGYIILGGKDFSNIWLIKTDTDGNKLWEKTFSRSDLVWANSIQQTEDGGFIIGGNTYADCSGDVGTWLIKTDADGNRLWDKVYCNKFCNSVSQTKNSGYIVIGSANDDISLIRTDSSGKLEWSKTLGGPKLDSGSSIMETLDGGFIICGQFISYGKGMGLIKTDKSGNVEWVKDFTKSSCGISNSVKELKDGGFIATGIESSGLRLIKTNFYGNTQWDKTFSGIYLHADNIKSSVAETIDRGYIVAAANSSTKGNSDFWLIKTDSNGNKEWCKRFDNIYNSGLADDRFIQQTSDGGYIFVGSSKLYSDKYDIILVKTDSMGGTELN